MKTNQEIQSEAQRLTALGNQFQNEQRIANVSALVVEPPRVRMNLPMNPAMPARSRHVEAVIIGGALVFRLMERETDISGSDRSEHEADGTLLASSPSAYDVLSTGYEQAEEERLTAALERYAERNEDNAEPADGETVAEVEEILEAKLLPHADRMRTKSEVMEFLEGRLEPSMVIARSIERRCSHEGYDEHRVERRELKLTMGEP